MTVIEEQRDEFIRLTTPLRRELLTHCYRMLGSLQDAEDLVQDTYLRAWRSYGEFEGRASLRTWLYRIATNACLNALRHGSRRVLPAGLGAPATDPIAPTARHPEIAWLEPIPDERADPAAIVSGRAGLRLALIAALQHLPAQQRTVLILRDVLAWSAEEAAAVLGVTPASVHSTLKRARARLERLAPAIDEITEPPEQEQRDLLDRYADAFERADIPALTRLLTEDAVWQMPPNPAWFAGRDHVIALLTARLHGKPVRLLPLRANGQPGFASYAAGRAYGVQVLTLRGPAIAEVTAFHDASLVARFGLPSRIEHPSTLI
ncbi:RNA polymerase ECF family sigma subunit [Streptomyces sp. 3212.3]|uniref:sigma-70 family RNA polymerase sigma factor n=1 Tax=Streptomyces sp. 3212.3 TaxID=1938846 RepID=UPI000E261A05|nr:sigma-70 family RNA polymerase sigma factor [Streptomyces sp. 3212.3]REE57730.1 RNA polymerase ECF family sigma subunit [Streptomyces sp. 3212.3]